jgi:uncharacterized membrane protein (UPF0127 family)
MMLRSILLAALLSGVLQMTAARAQQPQLPLVRLTAGMHVIQAEVADSFGTRMQGLMKRKSLEPNHGMLFLFDADERQCMWMKNTLIPLSVAFIDAQGVVINIADMQPHSEESHCSARPGRYALEMTQGWFREKGIKPGARLGGIPGAAPTR